MMLRRKQGGPESSHDQRHRRLSDRREVRRAKKQERLAARKDRGGDKEYKTKSALRAVVGNATLTRRSVVIWFVQAPTSTSFRPPRDVEEQIASAASALGELAGCRVYTRVSTRPYAARSYAEATHEDARRAAEPLPEWGDFLEREQSHMIGSSLSEKWVYLGVRVAAARRYPRSPQRELYELRGRVQEVTDLVATHGLEATPCSESDMEWMLRRSIGLGLPAPNVDESVLGDYEVDDLPDLWEHAQWSAAPGAKTITVRGVAPDGTAVSRRVGILTMGRMTDMEVPQDRGGGWMQRTDRLPFPVEWMATTDVLPNDRVIGKLRKQMDIILDQYKHYTEDHGLDPPESLKRQRALSLAAEDEVEEGLGGTATRTEGWYRLAVWGDSEEEVLKKISTVKKLYGRKVSWWHNADQYCTAREFIAGEPLANTAARRRMSVAALAAALPAATAEIGDRYGAVLGWTSGTSRRAVAWHPWRDMEEFDRSGLMIVAGTLGSGKTVAGVGIVYRTVMAGTRWTVFDPSGRLGSMCQLPELKKYSRYVDLLQGREGELNPYRVVAEPRREHFENESTWRIARDEAAAQRKSLCKDILRSFLPAEMRKTREAASVLTRAINAVGGAPSAAPNQVLRALLAVADSETDSDLTQMHRIMARDIYTELASLAGTPKGKLIFPAAGLSEDFSKHPADGPQLTVYSLAGLDIPKEETLRAGDESPDTRMSLVLFNLAAWLTQRSIYRGDPDERKGLMIDEGHMLSPFSAGRALIQKSATDSRKHNARILLSSQNVTHFELGDVGNLVGAALIGKTRDVDAAKAALSVLGLDPRDSYIEALAGLSRRARGPDPEERRKWREFVFADGRSDGAERIVFDMHAHPHVLAAVDSTPDASRSAHRGEEVA